MVEAEAADSAEEVEEALAVVAVEALGIGVGSAGVDEEAEADSEEVEEALAVPHVAAGLALETKVMEVVEADLVALADLVTEVVVVVIGAFLLLCVLLSATPVLAKSRGGSTSVCTRRVETDFSASFPSWFSTWQRAMNSDRPTEQDEVYWIYVAVDNLRATVLCMARTLAMLPDRRRACAIMLFGPYCDFYYTTDLVRSFSLNRRSLTRRTHCVYLH